MNWRPLAGGLAALAVLGLVPLAAAAPQREPDMVTCENRAAKHTLFVRMRDRVERVTVPKPLVEEIGERVIELREPSFATLERRYDEVTVLTYDLEDLIFGPGEGSPVACGPSPTVANTDQIKVRLGKESKAGFLNLDLRYGSFAPGLTDEGDGASEIEVDARVGRGSASARMTRGPDSVVVQRADEGDPGPARMNLNAAETSPDFDVSAGRNSSLYVGGGGSDDVLTSVGGRIAGPLEVRDLLGVTVDGGQGADALTGGDGSEWFLSGSGADRVDAGGGSDIVFASGHATDRIDCGPGTDFVAFTGTEPRMKRCEEVEEEDDDDLFFRVTPRKLLERPELRRQLSRRLLRGH